MNKLAKSSGNKKNIILMAVIVAAIALSGTTLASCDGVSDDGHSHETEDHGHSHD